MPCPNEYYIKHSSENFVFIAEHKGALQIREIPFINEYVNKKISRFKNTADFFHISNVNPQGSTLCHRHLSLKFPY